MGDAVLKFLGSRVDYSMAIRREVQKSTERKSVLFRVFVATVCKDYRKYSSIPFWPKIFSCMSRSEQNFYPQNFTLNAYFYADGQDNIESQTFQVTSKISKSLNFSLLQILRISKFSQPQKFEAIYIYTCIYSSRKQDVKSTINP